MGGGTRRRRTDMRSVFGRKQDKRRSSYLPSVPETWPGRSETDRRSSRGCGQGDPASGDSDRCRVPFHSAARFVIGARASRPSRDGLHIPARPLWEARCSAHDDENIGAVSERPSRWLRASSGRRGWRRAGRSGEVAAASSPIREVHALPGVRRHMNPGTAQVGVGRLHIPYARRQVDAVQPPADPSRCGVNSDHRRTRREAQRHARDLGGRCGRGNLASEASGS